MPDFLAEVLSWPQNYQHAIAVQTAYELGLPPTSLILPDKQPSDPWSPQDKKLAIAYTILKRETCSQCGQPIWICRSSNSMLAFSVRSDVCYAKAALDRHNNSKTAKKEGPGEFRYVVPEMLNGDAFPRRMDYLKEQIEDNG
jgi:hypothetical protein